MVVVVLTHGEVDVVPWDELLHDVDRSLDVLEHLFVLILSNHFALGTQVLVFDQQCVELMRALFEDNQTVYGPGIESETVCRVITQFLHELKDQETDLIIAVSIGFEDLLDYLDVLCEPVEDKLEVFEWDAGMEHTSYDMDYL